MESGSNLNHRPKNQTLHKLAEIENAIFGIQRRISKGFRRNAQCLEGDIVFPLSPAIVKACRLLPFIDAKFDLCRVRETNDGTIMALVKQIR
jgi:hypothetical protein